MFDVICKMDILPDYNIVEMHYYDSNVFWQTPRLITPTSKYARH
jgi:hypothetical protein